MKTRIISGAVLLPLLLFFIIYGGLPLHLAVVVISIMGMYEFYKVLSGKILPVHFFGFAMCVFYGVFAQNIVETAGMFSAMTACFIVLLMCYMVLRHKEVDVKDVFITFFGFYYVCFLLMHICLVRNHEYGQYFVWLIFIASFVCDTGAYFTGITMGKHKLIPELSPKKTIEGGVGGLLMGTIIPAIFYYYFIGSEPVWFLLLMSFVLSFISELGDLLFSKIKRENDIKDFSNLIPGHGGILDRFDSAICVVLAYILFLQFI